MNYINTTTGEYPVSESTIRAANPNTSYPVPFVAPDGYAYVFPSPQPEINPVTQRVQSIDPVLTTKGTWEQRWEVVELYSTQLEKDEALLEDKATKARAIWEQIKLERDRRKALGIKVGDHWFHSDVASRIQQIGLVMMGADIPAGLQWKTLTVPETSIFVPMTQATAMSLFMATAESDLTIFGAAEAHRLAMEASNDPAAYDFSAGWPVAFGEA